MKKILFLSLIIMSLFGSEFNTIKIGNNFEPSGLAIKNNLIYVISDNGKLAIIENNKVIYNQKLSEKHDYEGITFDKDGFLYLMQESKDKIILLDKDFEILNKYEVNRRFNGVEVITKGGDGLESLAFHKQVNGKLYFFSANQSMKTSGKDQSAILYIEVNPVKETAEIIKYIPSEIVDISGIFVRFDKVYIISDTNNKIYLFDTDLNFKKSKHLPGESQEGIIITDKDVLYIAQDHGDVIYFESSFLDDLK